MQDKILNLSELSILLFIHYAIISFILNDGYAIYLDNKKIYNEYIF